MRTILTSIAASGLLAALAIAQTPQYTVIDLGTLGGTYSYAYDMNNAGWVAGAAATTTQTGGLSQTAFLWHGGHMTNLGTLGGLNSAADAPNGSGQVPIVSETSQTDPNGEDFCEFGTHLQCRGAIWQKGVMTALPTLKGGYNAAAFGINYRGQVIGFAENGIRDPTCMPGGSSQVIRFEAVIWEPNGGIRELPPLKGDTVGFAFGINDKGQVAGSSGLCSNTAIPPYPSGAHAVLWEKDGTPVDLGSLGGTTNVADAINNLGEVVGTAQSPVDGTLHAFLWTKRTGMRDLGAFPGAAATVPPCCNTINDRGEVVGFSIDGTTFSSRALIWKGNGPKDLNQFIPAGSPWYLQAALSINNAGEIAGYGLINGEVHGFLARPR